MVIIAVGNEKGGTGKTTTALTVGSALVECGQRVGLIGLDPQRDLSWFAPRLETDDLQFFDATSGTLKRTLKEAGRAGLTYALLDCPPALGKEVAAALTYADLALVPVQPEALSVGGLARMIDTIQAARDSSRRQANPGLSWRVLLTLFDASNPDSYTVEADLRERLGDIVLPGIIKRHPAFASAALERRCVLQSAPRIHPAHAYRAVARGLLNEGWPALN